MTSDELLQLLRSLGLQKIIRRGENYMACCPKHDESRPSWGINQNAPHLHGCFSCGYKGSLLTLLLDKGYSLSRAKETIGDTSPEANFNSFDFSEPEEKLRVVKEENLFPFQLPPAGIPYLTKRGINLKTQQRAGVLWDHNLKRVIFPWWWGDVLYGATGRAISELEEIQGNKIISYFGLQKRQMLYVPLKTLDPEEPVILVEGEIDALRVFQAGFRNVAALGHGRFSKGQIALLSNLPVKIVLLFFDNDETGKQLTDFAVEALQHLCKVCVVPFHKELSVRRKKLDPGSMNETQIHISVERAVPRVYWPKFSC